jgi:peptidoglycan/xylan/chitin deacetylase (PgdA/CDA1 family)
MRFGERYAFRTPLLFSMLILIFLSAPTKLFAAQPSDQLIRWMRDLKDSLSEVDPTGADIDIASDVGFFANAKHIKGHEAKGYVSFTFDDGPKPKTTTSILTALERYHVPGTFFVVGRRFTGSNKMTRQSKAILKDIVQRGHHLGNHTYDHSNLRRVPPKKMKHVIQLNRDRIIANAGFHTHLFRPPYGASSKQVHRELARKKDVEVMWTIDSLDYRRALKGTMVNRVLKKIIARDGGVVLFHDTKPWTASELPKLLRRLEAFNCDRLREQKQPIVPVSLHYFTQNKDRSPRPLPDAVTTQTEHYRQYLEKRCTLTH